MQRVMLKSKIHRATVTEADLNYVGSITIDADLLDASDIRPHEQVQESPRETVVPGAGPDGAGDHPAVPPDEDDSGRGGDPVGGRHRAVAVEEDGRRDALGLHPGGDLFRALPEVDQEHGELLAPPLLVQLLDRRG